MSIKRITISVPGELADRIKKASGDKPVSTWVTELIEHELDEEEADRLWEEYMAEVGPIPQEAQDWADDVLRPSRETQGRRHDTGRDAA